MNEGSSAEDLLNILLDMREHGGHDLSKMSVGVHSSIGTYDEWQGYCTHDDEGLIIEV